MTPSTRLVLTRKFGQTILIGDNIIIRVIQIRDNYVKILVEAPREIKILRGELINEAPKSSSVNAQ